ncbi:MAG: hypothetical protein OHK0045_20150 [Raineya sp.]
MAGAKETPRQQMINLMYLVLTALLALQVSSSIIDKFLYIKKSLDVTANETKQANDRALKFFEKDTVGVNLKEHESKVQSIRRVQELANKRIELLVSMENLIIDEAAKGKDPETGGPKEPGGGETKIEELFVYKTEGATDKKGYVLKRELNSFAAEVAKEVKAFRKDLNEAAEFPPLCLDNKDRKDFQVKKGMELEINKNFSEAAFQATPVAAALAVISHLKTEVRRYEAKAISAIAQKEIPPTPDKYTAVVALESAVIASGQKLKGKVFLVASSSKANMKPKYELSVPVIDEGGMGVIEFTPSGNGKITGKVVADVGKGPQDFPIDPIDYEIRKPSVRLVSGTTRYAVYKGCKHTFDVISELNPFNPNITISNANRLRGSKPTELSFVPTGKVGEKVNISVSAQGLSQPYKDEMDILPVPPPNFLVVQGTTKRININNKPVVAPGQLFKIEIQPDEQFLRAMGATEANYSPPTVRSVRILKSDGTPMSGSLSELASKSRPGMTYEIDVVTTRNGSGGPEPIIKSFYVPVR